MQKTELRNLYKTKRTAIVDSEFAKMTDLLLIQFQSLHLDIPNHILSYLPFEKYNEIDLSIIEDYCKWKNPACTFCYPVINDSFKEMEAMIANADQSFTENKYGIPEPFGGETILKNELDMVFVPLLAFDKLGYRLGYGKGYYDRFLVNCKQDVLKIGFSFFEALADPMINDDFDVPLDVCVTPNLIYHF